MLEFLDLFSLSLIRVLEWVFCFGTGMLIGHAIGRFIG